MLNLDPKNSPPLYVIIKDDAVNEMGNGSHEDDIVFFDIINEINHAFESDISEFVLEDGSVISDHIINKNPIITFNASVTNNPHKFQKVTLNENNTGFEEPGTDLAGFGYNQPSPIGQKPPILIPDIEYPKFKEWERRKVRDGIRMLIPSNFLQAGTQQIGQDISKELTGRTPAKFGTQPSRDKKELKWNIPDLPAPTSWEPLNKERTQNIFKRLIDVHRFQIRCNIVTDNEYYESMYLQKMDVPIVAEDGETINFSMTFYQIKMINNFELELSTIPKEIQAQGSKNKGTTSPGTNKNANAQSDQAKRDKAKIDDIITDEQP